VLSPAAARRTPVFQFCDITTSSAQRCPSCSLAVRQVRRGLGTFVPAPRISRFWRDLGMRPKSRPVGGECRCAMTILLVA